MLLTNCPNCGSPLNEYGNCEYCNTKVRYANLLEITKDKPVELCLNIREDDKLISIPLKGMISEISINQNQTYAYDAFNRPLTVVCNNIDVSFVFNGNISKEKVI